ncbi:MAG: efflux transporter outer membrane subunit [Mizugakiibacter sp.]|uniref:efflux transporter outer membrane subunit n=1 Tax=Mizugakiibacter sp. TaxID=1972610 RepID=UPI0031CA534E|nr:efflux transporter outer membrane subunit [Xanthomonadaceae bacterium]
MPSKPLAAALAAALLLAACIGVPPKPAAPVLREAAPLAGVPASAQAHWPDAAWWRRYRDPQLDALVERAVAGAPALATAQTRFEAARAAVRVAAAAGGARLDASAQASRERLSDNGLIPPRFLGFNWYTQGDLGLQFRYDFDWWGKQRAAIESALDQAHAAEAERSAAALLLQAAVADTYFGWQADQARLALARQAVAAQARLQRLAALRVQRGLDPADAQRQADAALAAAREQQAALQGSAELRRVALAALLGVAPAELPALDPRPLPAVDAALPADAGLDLLARRPDVAASRWRVEAAAKQTEAARAAFYPDISLQALAGFSSVDMDKLLTGGSRVFALTPAIHLPLFDADRLRAQFGASRAELDAAVAAYDASVVEAARDVATQAVALRQIDARRRERAAQVEAGTRLRGSAAARERQGLTDARAGLAAETALLQQRDAAVQLDAQALAADIALIKALGGGYRADADLAHR